MGRRVLLDVDGVLADLVGSLCQRLPGGWTPERFTSYDFDQVLPARLLVQALGAMADVGFAYGLAEYPGARAFVNALKGAAEVVAVTKPFAGASTWAHERTRWLWDRGIERIVHTAEKHMIRGDVLIEDDPRNIEAWLAESPGGTGILMDRPWNPCSDSFSSYARLDRVQRALSFDHVLKILEATK